MTASEFGSFVLAFLVALILFFGGQRALIELTDNEDFAIPVQAAVEEPDVPAAPPVPPESVPGPTGGDIPPGGTAVPEDSGEPESEIAPEDLPEEIEQNP